MAELDPNVDWGYVDNLLNQIRSLYPSLAWMLNVPELADLILKAGREEWDSGRIQAALQNTQWWKDRNQSGRAFEELLNTDPATAEQQVSSLKTQIQQFAGRNGFTISEPEAIYIARESLVKGRTQQEWQTNVLTFLTGQKGQKSGPTTTSLKALAAEYAVPMSDATLQKWANDMLTGMVDENAFRAYLIEQAKSLFPGLANALDRGITVNQYVQPYAQIAAQELEINPNSIDWTDPKWSAAIHKVDPKTGVPTSMSLSDWTRELRSNPVYGFDRTVRAQEQASQLGQALLQRLGRAA